MKQFRIVLPLCVVLICSCINCMNIFQAIMENNISRVKELVLVEPGLVNVRDNYKVYPLHYAIKNGSTELATFLIEHGADVNVRDYMRETPLHCAVRSVNCPIVLLLLKYKSCISAPDKEGRTPLTLLVKDRKQLISTILFDSLVPFGGELMQKYDKAIDLLKDWPLYKRYRQRQLLAFVSAKNYLESPANILTQPLYQYITEFIRAGWREHTVEQVYEIAEQQRTYEKGKNKIIK